MSSTGTRPPLFDPDPEGFDEQVSEPRFPRRPAATGGRGARPTGGSTTSPRWVRPFIFGGLVLVGVISLISVFSGSSDDIATTTPVTTPGPSADPVIPDPVPADPGTADPGTATVQPTATPAPAAPEPQMTAESGIGNLATDVPTLAGSNLQAATAFAVQFAHDYLNFDEANPDIRQRDLRQYLAPGLDPQLGWDGKGTQLAVLTLPVDAQETGRGARVVVAAQVTGRDAPRWVHLAVELARDDLGRLAVTDVPAFVARPQPGTPTRPADLPADRTVAASLQPDMQSLFAAYAADTTVQVPGVTVPDASIRGLGGQVSLGTVGTLQVPEGDSLTREATIEVRWTDDVTGGSMLSRYRLDLVSVDGDWFVQAIRGN